MPDLDQALARGDLAVDRDGVLEVAQQDVDRRGDVGHLGDHLLVREVEEVDHPRGLEGDLASRARGAPMASGLRKSRGLRKWSPVGLLGGLVTGWPGAVRLPYQEGKATSEQAIAAARGRRADAPPGKRHPSSRSDHESTAQREVTTQMSSEFTTDQAQREASGAHSVRPLPGGVRGRRRLQALARQDRHRGRRSPLLPDHDEPPPAAHQRRLRRQHPAGAQRRRRAARLLARARDVRQRRFAARRSRTSRPRSSSHPNPVFHGDTLFVETEVLETKESQVQARPRHGQGSHARLNQDGVLVAEFKRLVLVPRRIGRPSLSGAARPGRLSSGGPCGRLANLPPDRALFCFPEPSLARAPFRVSGSHFVPRAEMPANRGVAGPHEHHRSRPHQSRPAAWPGSTRSQR